MRTSEKIDQIALALLNFQQATEPPKKNSTADTGKFKYDYADLCSLFAHCKAAMIANGLVFTSVGLTSRLMHVSGQWIEGDFPCELNGLSAQQIGSAFTYGRRYSFQGLLGINAEDDDDGAAATKPASQGAAKPAAKPSQSVPGFRKLGPNESKLHPPAEPDRVPASVTDASPDQGEEGGPPESMEVVTLKAFTKEKTDKKGQPNRGVLLTFPDGSEGWWNLYNGESMAVVGDFKGKQVYAKLEDKNGFKICHELTAVQG